MAAKRILIVDDEQHICEMLEEVLVGAGYEVESAADAQAALEQIRAHMFDAAILDFNLPDMNGVMLHRQIRQMDEELADSCLFTSGFVQSNDNLGYYSTYGGGFLSKPFDLQEVLEAVAALCGGR